MTVGAQLGKGLGRGSKIYKRNSLQKMDKKLKLFYFVKIEFKS